MTIINDTTLLRNIGSFLGEGKDIPTTRVVVKANGIEAYNEQPLSPGDLLVEYTRSDFSSQGYIVAQGETVDLYTAEEWLGSVGFTPLRLLTCLDLESKLTAASLASPKLNAVRQWIDQITLMAAPNPDVRLASWPTPPYSFAESSGEALTLLQA